MNACDRHPSALAYGRWWSARLGLDIALCNHCNNRHGLVLMAAGMVFLPPIEPGTDKVSRLEAPR